MPKLSTIETMRDAILCWTIKNIPSIAKEIRRGTVQIHEGRVYIWIDLPDVPKVFTGENATRIAFYWQQLCQHFNHNAQLFIQSDN